MNIPDEIDSDFVNSENDLVLMSDMTVGRLIDIEETTDDFYWCIQKMHNKEEHYSCVMGFITLKDQLSEEDYNKTNTVFKLNE